MYQYKVCIGFGLAWGTLWAFNLVHAYQLLDESGWLEWILVTQPIAYRRI
jgi:hypothetical protein